MCNLMNSKNEERLLKDLLSLKRGWKYFYPFFAKLRYHGVEVVINTRNPNEYDSNYYNQILDAIGNMQNSVIT